MSDRKKSIFLFILGMFFIMIPSLSNFIYKIESNALLEDYYEKVENNFSKQVVLKDEEPVVVRDYLLEEFVEYNNMIYETGQRNLLDPFSFEVASVDLTKYGFEENIVGDIFIERLDITLPLYLGATKENMKKGATVLGCTSLPVGGENTNCVIAAHRGMSTKEMFRNIEKIQLDDIIIINNFWGQLKYKVVETRVIYPDDVENVLIQDNRDLITLSTCHPYRYNYQRYLVFAERVIEE